MKYLVALSILFSLNGTAQVQRVNSFDSRNLKKVNFKFLPVKGKYGCIQHAKDSVFLDKVSWLKYNNECKDSIGEVDFNKNGVWQRESWGDCHAIYTHELFLDTAAKKMIWLEHNRYGGCRGMDIKYYRILFPKPPGGYTFELKEIVEDR